MHSDILTYLGSVAGSATLFLVQRSVVEAM